MNLKLIRELLPNSNCIYDSSDKFKLGPSSWGLDLAVFKH